jgi:hypothetical protein
VAGWTTLMRCQLVCVLWFVELTEVGVGWGST